MSVSPLIIPVHEGQPRFTESWVYVWHRDRAVTYVGGTGLPPALRTWLHLNDGDPNVGRVAARYREAGLDIGDGHDVLAFALPPTLERSYVKDALISRLASRRQLAADQVCDNPAHVTTDHAVDFVIDEITEAIRIRAAELPRV